MLTSYVRLKMKPGVDLFHQVSFIYIRTYAIMQKYNNKPSLFDLAEAPSTENPIDLAQKCDTSQCTLPYCFCSRDGTIIPGGLDPKEVFFDSHKNNVFTVGIYFNLKYDFRPLK